MQQKDNQNREILDAMHQDPNNWILGVFYFNKEDKRILPPKRIGTLGVTINFANPYSIVALLGIILLVIILANIIA